MKKIFVSILHFNNEKATRECLSSLNKINKADLDVHVVIIDNGSFEKLVLREQDYSNTDIRLVRSDQNTGFSGGHNMGISYALAEGATHVLILNNDTVLDKNILIELLKGFKIDREIGVTVPKIYFSKGSEFHKDRYEDRKLGKVIWFAGAKMDWNNVIGHHIGVDEVDNGQFDKARAVELGSGACMMVKREVFEKVGLFDEKYFLYYEDSDLFMRIRKAGFLTYFIPTAFLWHHNATSGGGSGSSLQDYYITRNRLLFGMSYGSSRAKLALVRESIRLLLFGRKEQKAGIKDFYLRNLGKGSFTP